MSARQERVERLRQSRAADSEAKRARAIETAQNLHRTGVKVTFARVAREAAVSTWLVYNIEDVRDTIQGLIDQQEANGITEPPATPRAATSDSLRTDLALAREEVKRLRAENKKYVDRLRETLGAEAEAASTPELVARVQELETTNATQHQQLVAQETELDSLRRLVEELRDELDGKAEALRRMMHATNT